MKVKKGESIPLTWTAPNGATNKVVSAVVYDSTGAVVNGVAAALTHLAHGVYVNASVAMPGTKFARAVIQIFQPDGTTPSTDTDATACQVFSLDTQVFIDTLTGFLDSHFAAPVRDTVLIVRGETKTIPVTLMQSRDNFAPLDISAATEVIVRLVNSDQTKLEKKLSLGDVVIVTGPAGQLTVTLSSTDTAGLRLSDRQNMEVEVQFSGGTTKRIVAILGKVNVMDTVTV